MASPLEMWVEKCAELTQPDEIYWCNGSEEEAYELIERGIKRERICGQPVFCELNHKAWPNAYLHRSHPGDVARTEHLTFVCHPDKEMAGPNNNWMDPNEAKEMLTKLTKGCMRGRTMYVLPYLMGHPESPYAKACVQVTDSCYVAVSMRIMCRMGEEALKCIGDRDDFVKGIHSIGDLDPQRRFIMHFPQEDLVWSIGSGYGGNALLGKKCFSLRIASWLGYHQGWLAEHMLIIGVEDPDGNVTYIAAALPSACGKSNLAMLQPTLEGYKVWTLGDDIAWLHIGSDGRLYAINPETGIFGVAPGTSERTNPRMLETLKAGKFYPTLFTNTGVNLDTNEPWWEGLTEKQPPRLLNWRGEPWEPTSKEPVAHPNARFTVSLYNCPTLSPEFENPNGVPISAIIFGVRRTSVIPLVYESFDWKHGVFCGASMGSEMTPAALNTRVGALRRDPMAMIPFCGYNMADYFAHWLRMGEMLQNNAPKIFFVNWFRRDDDGTFLWPGFGENIRVLKWIIDRVHGRVSAKETPIGLIPRFEDMELSGLDLSREKFKKLFKIDKDEWRGEIEAIREFFWKFGGRMPGELVEELGKLEGRLWR